MALITCQDCGTEMFTATCTKCGASKVEEPGGRLSPLIPPGAVLTVGGVVLLFSGFADFYGMTAGILAVAAGGAMVAGGVLSD